MKINRTVSSLAVTLLVAAAAIATVMAQSTAKPAAGASSTASSSTTGTVASTTSSGDKNVQQTLQEILDDPTGGDAYHYDPQGRRDPFQSLIGPTPKLDKSNRPDGVPGFLIDEMKLQGVVKTRQGLLVAMVGGPDNKGYIIRVGDKTLDGEVIRITPSSVIFRQEVNDPTRIERFREVVKELSPVAQKK
jgi:type IV pilus assembly protein PilP